MPSAEPWTIIAIGFTALSLQPAVSHAQAPAAVSETNPATQVEAYREAPEISAQTNMITWEITDSVGTRETFLDAVDPIVARVIRHAREQEVGAGQLAEILRGLGGSDNVELNLDDARIVFGATEIARGEVVRGDLVVIGGNLKVKGEVTGDIIAFGGDVRLFRGALVGGDVVSIDGTVTGSTSLVVGYVRSIDSDLHFPAPRKFARFEIEPNVSTPVAIGGGIMTLLGTLVAFSSIGFGLTFFAPNQLSIVAGRVAESPGKSFMAGLFAQPLIFPALAMLTVGLAVSIVGIILIPFAIIAAVLVTGAMGVIGYLAVATSLGAKHARQKALSLGKEANPNQFEAMLRGLIITMAVWLPAVLLSWIPYAGMAVAAIALMFTWVVATAGLGAVITTRAGFQGQFPWRRRGKIDSANNTLTRF